MTKRLLLFLALSLCAAAQTLVGLPEYGITLSGSDKVLTLENHSGKTILATMVTQTHANGKQIAKVGYHMATIPDGVSLAIAGEAQHRGMTGYDSPVVELKLWAVVFVDGELRGTDPYTGAGSFQSQMEANFQAIMETGRLAAAGDWLELTRRAESETSFANHYAKQYAQQIIAARNGSGGEPAAREMAQKKFKGLPEHFWRAQ